MCVQIHIDTHFGGHSSNSLLGIKVHADGHEYIFMTADNTQEYIHFVSSKMPSSACYIHFQLALSYTVLLA